MELEKRPGLPLQDLLTSFAVNDADTKEAVRRLDAESYLADPHSALAWKALNAPVPTLFAVMPFSVTKFI